MPARLILASGSASRRRLLDQAGLRFDVEISGVDEQEMTRSLVSDGASARDIATALAEMKAVRVSGRRPGALVIGADSTLWCEGRLLDKPPTLAAARAQLHALAGRTHELCSSAVIARGGIRIWHCADVARLSMRPMTDAFIDRYLARAGDAVCASVGAYQLEGIGVHLFTRIEGDFFTILGLPLLPVLAFLAEHGIGLEDSA